MSEAIQKILVVDDEAQITRVLRRGLESQGFQVRIAGDGASALPRVKCAGASASTVTARIVLIAFSPLLLLLIGGTRSA